MVIDFHSHSFIPDAVAARAIGAMARNVEGVIAPIGDGTLSNQLDQMEHDGVDMAVMLPIATKPTQHGVILRNALAIREGRCDERSAKMLIPFMSVHPFDPELKNHIDEIASLGFRGVKVHPYYQNFSLEDPAVRPMFEMLASNGLVVVSHCGYDVGYPGRYDACGPKEIASLLKSIPDLVFVAAHLGGCLGFEPHATDEIVDLGCYADTSALMKDWMRDEEMRLCRSWPTERLLFGTDFPWNVCSETIRWVKSVRAESDWGAILGGNARRLLKI